MGVAEDVIKELEDKAKSPVVYEPSLMSAVKGIASIPGKMAQEIGVGDKAARLWGGIKDTAKAVAMSAGGGVAAQAASPTYVNPPTSATPGGLFRESSAPKPATPAPVTAAAPVAAPASPGVVPPPVQAPIASQPTGGGVSPDTFAKMQEVGRQAVAQSRFDRGPDGGANYDVSRTGKNEFTMTPKDRPVDPSENLGPIAATKDLREGYIKDAERTKMGLDKTRLLDQIDSQIKMIEGDSGVVPRRKYALISDLINKKETIYGRDVTAATANEGHDVQREGHGVQRRGQDITGKSYERMNVTEERKARISEGNLGETSRYHDLLISERKDKLKNDAAMQKEAARAREEGKTDLLMDRWGSYEDMAGVKEKNPKVAIFKLIDSGYNTDTLGPEWKPTADKLKADMKAYKQAQRAAGNKASDTELLAEFYNQLRGIKGVKK